MGYSFQRMTETQARDIATWRYPDQYSFYNPDETSLEGFAASLLEPNYAYHTMYDGAMLVGFCCFGEDAQVPGGDYSLPDTLDIGLGMRPELTGQGQGAAFLAAILAFAQRQYKTAYFRTTIAAFNLRSQRVFEKAGFQPVQRFFSHSDNPVEFVVMVKDAGSHEAATVSVI